MANRTNFSGRGQQLPDPRVAALVAMARRGLLMGNGALEAHLFAMVFKLASRRGPLLFRHHARRLAEHYEREIADPSDEPLQAHRPFAEHDNVEFEILVILRERESATAQEIITEVRDTVRELRSHGEDIPMPSDRRVRRSITDLEAEGVITRDENGEYRPRFIPVV